MDIGRILAVALAVREVFGERFALCYLEDQHVAEDVAIELFRVTAPAARQSEQCKAVERRSQFKD
jgi:hypothetical protein